MEFRPMRRKRQELPKEECEKILNNATAGVLSVLGDGGYPYGVPISYVYAEGKLYFHSAVEGHKLDAIVKEDKCSFTIIDQDEIHPDEYTTYFRSVITFGRIRRLESMEEILHCLQLLAGKYTPVDQAGLQHRMDKSVPIPGGIPHTRVTVLCMEIDHISGKEAIELVRAHKGQ